MSRKFFETYPHLEGLDKHSIKVAKFFLAAYPQWEGYAQIGTWEGESYFEMCVPSPHRPDEPGLIIDSASYDVTLHFDGYHAHFHRGRHPLKDSCEVAIKTFIEPMLKEEALVAVFISERGLESGMWITPDMIDSLSPQKWTYVRSWLGTYDKYLTEK